VSVRLTRSRSEATGQNKGLVLLIRSRQGATHCLPPQRVFEKKCFTHHNGRFELVRTPRRAFEQGHNQVVTTDNRARVFALPPQRAFEQICIQKENKNNNSVPFYSLGLSFDFCCPSCPKRGRDIPCATTIELKSPPNDATDVGTGRTDAPVTLYNHIYTTDIYIYIYKYRTVYKQIPYMSPRPSKYAVIRMDFKPYREDI